MQKKQAVDEWYVTCNMVCYDRNRLIDFHLMAHYLLL